MSYDRYQDDADRLLDLIQRVLAAVSEEAGQKPPQKAERRRSPEAEQKSRELAKQAVEDFAKWQAREAEKAWLDRVWSGE